MAAAAHHLLPGDEIDPKALKLCVARFKHHHDVRLAASKHRMTRRQRNVIDVLPLLYHRNHPALPGYINTTVPAGIPGYRATTEALGVAVGYRDPPHRAQPVDLQSIFIMGSSGSIAQNRASDVDLWVCCESHLHPALWPKVHAVNHWARTHGVEMQTYLVDPQTFQLGHPIPGCPTPTLLLDEFYRSATLIASPAPVQVFVNSETQTEPAALRRPGFTVVTHHDDPLDFSGSHKLLLRSVDVLRADGIDDWTLESRTDGASVLQCVTELTTTPPTRLAWHAIGGQSRFRIQKRLENLHIQLHAALQESGDRFVFPFGRDIVCATFDDGAVATTRHASEADLRTKLRTARARRTTFGRDSARLSAFN